MSRVLAAFVALYCIFCCVLALSLMQYAPLVLLLTSFAALLGALRATFFALSGK